MEIYNFIVGRTGRHVFPLAMPLHLHLRSISTYPRRVLLFKRFNSSSNTSVGMQISSVHFSLCWAGLLSRVQFNTSGWLRAPVIKVMAEAQRT